MCEFAKDYGLSPPTRYYQIGPGFTGVVTVRLRSEEKQGIAVIALPVAFAWPPGVIGDRVLGCPLHSYARA